MKIHLCGLPLNAHRRLKQESNGWMTSFDRSHQLRVTPIDSTNVRPFTRAERDEIRKAASEGFTHIVLVATRDWQCIATELKFDCRVHLIRTSLDIGQLDWTYLQEELNKIVNLDVEWLSRISPRDIHHQLLLPPGFFVANRSVQNYWERCDLYQPQLLSDAEALLTSVERLHHRSSEAGARVWIDEKGRTFDIDRSYHSRSTNEGSGEARHRFCLKLPYGFHYDVSKNNKNFPVAIGGHNQTVKHINVTPWGGIREG